MFDPDIDALRDDSVADPLVDHDTDRMRSDIEDTTRPSVVQFEGHTLLEGAVPFDVDQVTPFVHPQVCGQRFYSPAPERPGKQVPRPSPVPFRVRHDGCLRSLSSITDSLDHSCLHSVAYLRCEMGLER